VTKKKLILYFCDELHSEHQNTNHNIHTYTEHNIILLGTLKKCLYITTEYDLLKIKIRI